MLVLISIVLGVIALPIAYSGLVLAVNSLSMWGFTKVYYFWIRLGRAAFDEPGEGFMSHLFTVFSYLVFWPLDYAYRNMIGAPQFMVGLRFELMSDLVDRYLNEHIQLTKDVRALCKKHNVEPKAVMRSAIALGYFDVITDPEKGHQPHFGNPEVFS